jgi:hypothetical protein
VQLTESSPVDEFDDDEGDDEDDDEDDLIVG